MIGAALALLSALLVAGYFLFESISLSDSARRARLGQSLSAEFSPLPVDPDELFLPEEPELLPPIILSRKRRPSWSVEDARPFWTDPATFDPAPVKAAVDTAIDALFADIP